ncbi:unnamed protein product [Dovyalis caffra]|uniref:K-box domain-containing protein n=1 Tax=Dovyalis caffra TaxID=77055 RepID=A0AAV1RIA0_9ROSI|nr:unnamed protein product [Dovyalis caffra]
MESILERYERHSYAEQQLVPNGSENQGKLDPSASKGNWSMEHPKLMARVEALQRNLRNYTGQDLDPLSPRELQHLEQQIDNSLKRIRSRKVKLACFQSILTYNPKGWLGGQGGLLLSRFSGFKPRDNQLIHDFLSELQQKEKALREQNNTLTQQVKENEKGRTEQARWKQQNLGQNSSSFMLPLAQAPPQLPMLTQLPLTIGGSLQVGGFLNGNENVGVQTQPSTIPPWMLRHVNDRI